MEEIKVTIDAEGNVKVTVFGVKGGKCLELTKELEQLLGGEVEREFTSEYYTQTEAVGQKLNIKDRS
ncbi:MAG TPA: DUF2997 domain-containing protein [Deferrisomatales bacterium]|nr:DUF2997 domain-containing protein [Deferrisomatales bacterium]